MNHATDGNLAAIESHLNEQESAIDYGTLDEHRELAKWLAMTDEDKAKFYLKNPEAIPDSVGG